MFINTMGIDQRIYGCLESGARSNVKCVMGCQQPNNKDMKCRWNKRLALVDTCEVDGARWLIKPRHDQVVMIVESPGGSPLESLGLSHR
jgi:hypothetical protein